MTRFLVMQQLYGDIRALTHPSRFPVLRKPARWGFFSYGDEGMKEFDEETKTWKPLDKDWQPTPNIEGQWLGVWSPAFAPFLTLDELLGYLDHEQRRFHEAAEDCKKPRAISIDGVPTESTLSPETLASIAKQHQATADRIGCVSAWARSAQLGDSIETEYYVIGCMDRHVVDDAWRKTS